MFEFKFAHKNLSEQAKQLIHEAFGWNATCDLFFSTDQSPRWGEEINCMSRSGHLVGRNRINNSFTFHRNVWCYLICYVGAPDFMGERSNLWEMALAVVRNGRDGFCHHLYGLTLTFPLPGAELHCSPLFF